MASLLLLLEDALRFASSWSLTCFQRFMMAESELVGMKGRRVVLSWPTCKGDQLGYGGEKGEGGRGKGVGGCTRRCGWQGRDSGGSEVVRRTALIRLFGAAAAAWVSRWAVRACGSDWRGRGVVEGCCCDVDAEGRKGSSVWQWRLRWERGRGMVADGRVDEWTRWSDRRAI